MHTVRHFETKNVSQFELCKAIYSSGFLAQTDLSPTSKLVLIALANHFNPDHKDMFPSREFVANQLGISIKSVQRAVIELKNASLIIYDTKRVNRYAFTNIFFERVKLSPAGGQIGVNKGVKLSPKQIKEHENNKFFKKDFSSNVNPAKSPETTKKEMEKTFSGERKAPMDDYETAVRFIEGLTPEALKLSPIKHRALEVCAKWGIDASLLESI